MSFSYEVLVESFDRRHYAEVKKAIAEFVVDAWKRGTENVSLNYEFRVFLDDLNDMRPSERGEWLPRIHTDRGAGMDYIQDLADAVFKELKRKGIKMPDGTVVR